MRRLILGCSGIVLLIFSGMVHGLWTDRWTDRADLTAAAENLESLPMTLDDWQGENFSEPTEKAGLAGALARRYVHRTTGQVVSIYLGCGRPGPVSVHTPEVCYSGSGFQVESPVAFTLPTGPDMPRGELWTARFVKERPDGRSNLRLFWGWCAGGEWKIAENPRRSFAGERLLYKLYVVREVTGGDEPVDADPCIDFMRSLLPAVKQSCFPS
jgi:hypothetical protein